VKSVPTEPSPSSPHLTRSQYGQKIPLMNRDTIRLIGEFPAPSVSRPLIAASSIAMNKIGEIFFLCEGGAIRYLSSKAESAVTDALALNTDEAMGEMEMSHLEFNYSSSSLLVGGSECVGVVFFNQSAEGLSDFQVVHRCAVGDLILKVQWHPLSDTHLVLLLQSHKVLLVDVLSHQTTEIPLDETREYISFTFGPCVDWLRLCLFLLDSKGEVSYLCPILPHGAVLSSHSIYELKRWLSDERAKSNDQGGGGEGRGPSSSDTHFDQIDLYLRAAFGTYFDQLPSAPSEYGEEEDGDESGPTAFHRAGVPKSRSHLTPGTLYHKSFHQTPQVQGTLPIENRILKPSLSRHRSAEETIPCDLCVPIARGYNSVPLLLIVWSDGNIEELLISGQVGQNPLTLHLTSLPPSDRSPLEKRSH
jgi:hypothetical protein